MKRFEQLNEKLLNIILIVLFMIDGIAVLAHWIDSRQSMLVIQAILLFWAGLYGLHFYAIGDKHKGRVMVISFLLVVCAIFA